MDIIELIKGRREFVKAAAGAGRPTLCLVKSRQLF